MSAAAGNVSGPAARRVPRAAVGWAWRSARRIGAIAAIVAVYLALTGIVPVFNARPLIDGIISLGQTSLILTGLAAGYLAARLTVGADRSVATMAGMLAGAIVGAALVVLIVVGSLLPLRAVLLNASDELYEVLTLGFGSPGGWLPWAWVPLPVMAGLGAVGGFVAALPDDIRRPLSRGFAVLVLLGLFSNLIRTPMINAGLDVARFLFAQDGLQPEGAVTTVVAVTAIEILNRRLRFRDAIRELPAERRRALTLPVAIVIAFLVLVLPQALGAFFAQVIAIVALYILMGFGLNITLGLAGLLDLGFVAFFAVGAYTVGLLTSTAEFGIAQWSFWQAVPVGVLLAMLFGALLGLPILGIRGDYLAIATLGFGEIIRILAGSDLLNTWLGGPRGILNIPKPIDVPPDHFLAGPNQIYYIALLGAGLVTFISVRLRSSRLGRAWVAIREDEDVAEALGVSLVQTKLLAYMLGAAFAGLGGALFVGLIGSIFASSIDLFVSINVAAIVIVGGMGSIPGVVAGSIFLIGIPELFREFADYRFLFYGIALIAMMLYRPEGLLPSKIVRREFHDETIEAQAAAARAQAEAEAEASAAAEAASGGPAANPLAGGRS